MWVWKVTDLDRRSLLAKHPALELTYAKGVRQTPKAGAGPMMAFKTRAFADNWIKHAESLDSGRLWGVDRKTVRTLECRATKSVWTDPVLRIQEASRLPAVPLRELPDTCRVPLPADAVEWPRGTVFCSALTPLD